ncbi:MAG: hypothetical protein ACE5ER_12435 [Nitrospinaceae bacterium]
MTRTHLNKLAGTIWSLVGLMLILRGADLLERAMQEQHATQQALILAVVLSLVLGGIKGRFVLSKTARRNMSRIDALAEPLRWHQVYERKWVVLIAGMILLGVLLRTYNEFIGGFVVVGAIYCGIGLALLVSSLCYWKNRSGTLESGS